MQHVAKSFETRDPIIDYCSKLSVKQHPLQAELQQKTLTEAEMNIMLGAPEVLTFGQQFIQLIGGKKCIDVGTYTGASALAWALAVPDDGEVYTLDVNHDNYKRFGVPIISKCPKTLKKIHAFEGKALDFLDKLIADGKSRTFDFAFIDADKTNYSNYYNRIVELLRPGGVILVDNALFSGRVAESDKFPKDVMIQAINSANHLIFNDERTNSSLINVGDGLHVVFKK